MKSGFKKALLLIAISVFLSAIIYVLPVHGETEIYDKVIRLHVVANSDSELDQTLKLKVRDAVLGAVSAYTEGCDGIEEAKEAVLAHTDDITSLARSTLAENGCYLPVSTRLGYERYPTREYGDMRFPAGEYCSVRIVIGEGEGKNWWCVLFPPLCTSSASARDEMTQAGFTPGQVKILTDSDSVGYKLKFKILEIFESIFS